MRDVALNTLYRASALFGIFVAVQLLILAPAQIQNGIEGGMPAFGYIVVGILMTMVVSVVFLSVRLGRSSVRRVGKNKFSKGLYFVSSMIVGAYSLRFFFIGEPLLEFGIPAAACGVCGVLAALLDVDDHSEPTGTGG